MAGFFSPTTRALTVPQRHTDVIMQAHADGEAEIEALRAKKAVA
jgi:hypothetical protein